MNGTRVRISTIVGASAAVMLSTLGALIAGQSGDAVARPETSIGVTQTQTTAPKTLDVPRAVPSITGPAALPVEEQGLPG